MVRGGRQVLLGIPSKIEILFLLLMVVAPSGLLVWIAMNMSEFSYNGLALEKIGSLPGRLAHRTKFAPSLAVNDLEH